MAIFLDFEASSLSKASYPIEVGWVRPDGSGEALLIRPAPDWTDWDWEAERLHRLSRTRLFNEGLPVRQVADRLIALFAEDRVFASAPSWDGHWLSMLLRAAGEPRHLLRLEPTSTAFAEAARASGAVPLATEIMALRARLNPEPVIHRALADARREHAVWQALLARP